MNQEEHNINFKTSMLRSSLCDYSDAYILVKWNIKVNNTSAEGSAVNNTNKNLCSIYWLHKQNNTEVDNAKYIDIVMPMYNWKEYSENIWELMAIL